MHWVINPPPSETPPTLSYQPPLKSANCPSPPLCRQPPCLLVFCDLPPKNQIFL